MKDKVLIRIIPETPKILPQQQIYTYIPIVTEHSYGIAKFNSNFIVDQNGIVSLNIDTHLSEESNNPVANKIITLALSDKADRTEVDALNIAPGEGKYSFVQKTGAGGSHGSSNTEHKGASVATGKNAVALGVQGLSAGDCTLTSGYGAKAYEKGCVAFGTGVAGRTSAEWIAYYWDVENWTNAHYDNKGGVQLVEGDLPEDWQNKGIVQKPGTNEYYYVVYKSGSTWVKYGGFFLNPAYAEGQGTKAKGTWSHAQGYLTEALADFSDASGQQTKSYAHHGHVGGYNSNNYSPYGFVHGTGLESSEDIEGQTIFGKYNTKNSDALLQIGNGTGPGASARKTIFEVLKDGRVKVYGKPQDNNDAVRLKDLSEAIAGIDKLTRKVVETLPLTGENNVIYLVPNTKNAEQNIKDEYLWIDGKWELIGSTEIDLSDYQPKTDNGLNTTSKNIVGAINEVNEKAGQGGNIEDIPLATSEKAGLVKMGGTTGFAIPEPAGLDAYDNNYVMLYNAKRKESSQASMSNTVANGASAPGGFTLLRTGANGVLGAGDPAGPYHAVNLQTLERELDKKLDKITTNTGLKRAYIIDDYGKQAVIDVTDTLVRFGTIAMRGVNGALRVGSPVDANHAANKKYVDENKGTQLYRHKIIFDFIEEFNEDIEEVTYCTYKELEIISTRSTQYEYLIDAFIEGIGNNDFFGLSKCVVYEGEPFPYQINVVTFRLATDGTFTYPIAVEGDGTSYIFEEMITNHDALAEPIPTYTPIPL